MSEYKHYIRTNEAGVITHGFTSAFEQPQLGDMELSGQEGRHFQTSLLTDNGQYKYKILNGAMIQRTQVELDEEWATRPPNPPTVEERLEAAEQALLAMLEAM